MVFAIPRALGANILDAIIDRLDALITQGEDLKPKVDSCRVGSGLDCRNDAAQWRALQSGQNTFRSAGAWYSLSAHGHGEVQMDAERLIKRHYVVFSVDP